ncbi:oxidoreductase domain-containing protein [Lophiostoma macrostomum CBS 122681]|uniref:D-xylose 1-dehydrogenase (NADP(+), D-xylono-1,5-lactone-forming) n=1 Tax=Lophiostoma macrostomum CBS 122681 TaxID=1314788 RepID=A0A6A6TBQ4_9PLEO|nr:oxidoreductase domain-containing protein [Lophiostoma macrostomum CBS 122681]
MASVIGFLLRNYKVFNPPSTPKSGEPLRFGILGAANIAPMALIIPAISHPEVIVAAVAARDPKKAEAFAKKHKIPIVHKTYDDLIADPSLDCIYNPLPNGLHYEWTIKCLKAGKHVLLEKPSVSNATEARHLFRHATLNKPDSPVLLEAFHYRFHPAWQHFITLFDSADVEHVEVVNSLPAGVFSGDDIRFNYSLSGGTLMDFGAYAVSTTRNVFGTEPISVTSASYRPMPDGFDKQVDEAVYAAYEFPNGATAKISADLRARGGYWFPALTKNWPRLKDVVMKLRLRLKSEQEAWGGDGVKTVRREIVFYNYLGPYLWHRIDVISAVEYQRNGKIVEKEEKTEHIKTYKPKSEIEDYVGEDWWTTYRYQLEVFVDRVKKRKGSGIWVDGEESIRQMEAIDSTYKKLGLPLRPTSRSLETAA